MKFLYVFALILSCQAYAAEEMNCIIKLGDSAWSNAQSWSVVAGPVTKYLFGHPEEQPYIPDYERAENPYLRVVLRNSILRISWRHVTHSPCWDPRKKFDVDAVVEHGAEEFNVNPLVPLNVSLPYPGSKTLLIKCI